MILTPHIAGSTAEAQEAVGIQIALQVREYLKLGVVQNAVNLPSLSHEEYLEVAPYIEMAERLGHFPGAVPGRAALRASSFPTADALPKGKTELMRNSAVAGVLGHSENVNRINAAAIAAERGIRVHEEKKEAASGGAGTC